MCGALEKATYQTRRSSLQRSIDTNAKLDDKAEDNIKKFIQLFFLN